MHNFAREHFLKHQAKQAAADAAMFGEMRQTSVYEKLFLQLKRDQSLLKQIQATSSKIEKKKALFDQYKSYVDGILESCPNVPDEIISNMLVWTVDTGDYDYAINIMKYMLKAQLNTPDQFERTVATFVYEQVAETQLKLLSAEDEDEPFNLNVLIKLEELLHTSADFPEHAFDMPEQVKARLYVALGKAEMKSMAGIPEQDLALAKKAQSHLETAIKLDDRCRGKNDHKAVTKMIADLEQTTNVPTF
ncbi:phage terminase small subunit [Acinetobacter pollinis]|uniref:Terminase n=1 Tax=Acinetobacter pollinis TaxID=2605270 RepID=A0ABU6DXF9_9GAMM|nr:phage terminase small subunit [Acinetobacter pollinis]MEB5477577.1 terminase [Acinetobacter pollinis]